MTSPVPETDESVCWQCGAPAVPRCAVDMPLSRQLYRARPGTPPVIRAMGGGRGESMRLSIPRCEACQNRNYISLFLVLAGGAIGGLVGLDTPSNGWTFLVGAILGAAPMGFAVAEYHRRRGLRSIAEYPPLLALRAAGWSEPV